MTFRFLTWKIAQFFLSFSESFSDFCIEHRAFSDKTTNLDSLAQKTFKKKSLLPNPLTFKYITSENRFVFWILDPKIDSTQKNYLWYSKMFVFFSILDTRANSKKITPVIRIQRPKKQAERLVWKLFVYIIHRDL